MDPLKWMGTARCRVQTADKNNNNPQYDYSPFICEVNSCVCKKQIHQAFESSAEWYMEPSVKTI